jgi:hypothetical protein
VDTLDRSEGVLFRQNNFELRLINVPTILWEILSLGRLHEDLLVMALVMDRQSE